MKILGIAVLSALCSLAAYDARMRRDITRALAVIFLAAVAELLLSVTAELPRWSDLPDSIDAPSLTAETAGDAFADGVEAFLCDKFGFSEDDVGVYLVGFDFTTMHAEKIKVLLSGKARLADAHAVRAAVENAGLGTCEVEFEIG